MSHASKVRDITDMKLHNRALIWELIFRSRPVSRAQLAKMTDMSPTSITRIVGELAAFGLLVEAPGLHAGVGRKATMIDIDRDAVFSMGIDVDVGSVRTCLLDLENKPRSFLDRKFTGRQPSPGEVVDVAHSMYREMLANTGIDEDRVKAVGVAVGGTVEHATGVVTTSPQLHWNNVDVGSLLERRFGLPASVENDVKAAVFEEYTRHRECRAKNVAYLTIGSGIGAALMHNGELLRGGNNAAGEIGHIMVQPDGDICDCGRRGCLYTCLSEKAVMKRLRRHGKPSMNMERWIRARREGEAWAIAVYEEIAGFIAVALNHVLCAYDPEVVIVGGALLHAQPDLLGVALDTRGFIYDALRSDLRIIHSLSNVQDVVIGAAIMAGSSYVKNLLNESL